MAEAQPSRELPFGKCFNLDKIKMDENGLFSKIKKSALVSLVSFKKTLKRKQKKNEDFVFCYSTEANIQFCGNRQKVIQALVGRGLSAEDAGEIVIGYQEFFVTKTQYAGKLFLDSLMVKESLLKIRDPIKDIVASIKQSGKKGPKHINIDLLLSKAKVEGKKKDIAHTMDERIRQIVGSVNKPGYMKYITVTAPKFEYIPAIAPRKLVKTGEVRLGRVAYNKVVGVNVNYKKLPKTAGVDRNKTYYYSNAAGDLNVKLPLAGNSVSPQAMADLGFVIENLQKESSPFVAQFQSLAKDAAEYRKPEAKAKKAAGKKAAGKINLLSLRSPRDPSSM